MVNKSAISGLSGNLKIWTVIIGAIVVGLVAHSTYYQSVKEHEVFFGSAVACMVISLVFLLGALIGIMEGHDAFKKVDVLYHVIASLLLIASGIVFIIDVDKRGDCRGTCKDLFAERISAGTLGLLNGLIYGYIAWLMH